MAALASQAREGTGRKEEEGEAQELFSTSRCGASERTEGALEVLAESATELVKAPAFASSSRASDHLTSPRIRHQHGREKTAPSIASRFVSEIDSEPPAQIPYEGGQLGL